MRARPGVLGSPLAPSCKLGQLGAMFGSTVFSRCATRRLLIAEERLPIRRWSRTIYACAAAVVIAAQFAGAAAPPRTAITNAYRVAGTNYLGSGTRAMAERLKQIA